MTDLVYRSDVLRELLVGHDDIIYIDKKATAQRIKAIPAVEPKQGEMINISQQDFATLCICALRYCHGRRTYMPSIVQKIVSEHFCDLSSRDLAVIEQDKSFQSHMDLWGDQCDKADWLRFYKELERYREGADDEMR